VIQSIELAPHIKTFNKSGPIFLLQKILASQERSDSIKKEKDLASAQTIGELCLQFRQRRARLKFIFNKLPQTWQKKIIKITQEISPELNQFLSQRA